MKLDKYTNEEIEQIIKEYDNMWQFCKSIGYTNKSSKTYKLVRKNLIDRGISIPYKERKGVDTTRKPDEEVFCENSTYDNKELKKRIIRQNRLEYKCSSCSVTEWMGQPLTLQLDHINGVNTDNRIKNLRFMCPNCHSQTPTWGRKSR